MVTLWTRIRHDKRAVAGKALVVLALVTLSAVGAYIVFYENDYVRIEGRIHDVDASGEPVTAQLDIRLTNKFTEDLVIESVHVTAWADESKEVLIADEDLGPIFVAKGESTEVTQLLEIRNSDALETSIWIEWSASWAYGDDHHSTSGERAIDIGSELLPFTSE